MHTRGEPIARICSGGRRDVPPAQAGPGSEAAETFVVAGVMGSLFACLTAPEALGSSLGLDVEGRGEAGAEGHFQDVAVGAISRAGQYHV